MRHRWSAATTAAVAAGLLVVPAHAVAPSPNRSPAATVRAISPIAGPDRGGNQLTISGTRLSGVTAVRFGSAVSRRITHVSAKLLTVRVPKHAAGAVDVRLVSGRATSARTGRGRYSFTAGAGDLRWGRTRTIDPTRGALIHVSCGTPSFCVAIDSRYPAPARLVRFDPSGAAVSTRAPMRQPDAVACASATYCIAGSAASATEWNGRSWSAVHRLARWSYTEAMACAPQSTLCVLVGNGSSLVRRAGSWHRTALPAAFGDHPLTLSCAAATFCLAIDGTHWARFDGTRWGNARTFRDAPPDADAELSCASASYCLAVDGYWAASWTPSSGWRDLPAAMDQNLARPLCIATNDCLVGGEYGPLLRWDGTTLRRAPAPPAKSLESVATCLPGVGCFFVDDSGHGYEWTAAHTWTHAHDVVPAQGTLIDVSCASTRWCVAVDEDGNELTWTGRRWTPAHRIDRLGRLAAVSCVSRAFCVAVGSNLVMRTAGRWRSPRSVDSRALTDVACPSARFCVAIDAGGRALRWNGHRWSAPTSIGGGPVAVSCASASSCLAVGKGSARWDGHRWHAVANPQHAWLLTGVDCVTATYCTSGGIGGFYVRHDGLWSHVIKPSIGIDEVWLSCASVRLCIGEADIGEGAAAEDYAFDGASIHQHKRYDIDGVPDCVATTCATVDYDTATVGHR